MKLLGLHEHCGGEVNEMENGAEPYRYCCLCGARGVNAMLMSEIFESDDDTVVTPVPDILELDIEIVTDDQFEIQPKVR